MTKRRKRSKPDKRPVASPQTVQRKRRRFAPAAGALLVLSSLGLVAFLNGRAPSRWPANFVGGSARGFNVLLITLDTTRADHLGCYGHVGAQTPALDRLAAGGIRFDDAVTAAPITLPSHTTILTGLYPPNHRVRNNGEFRLGAEHETLAELLRGQGYDTSAFVSAFVLDERFGLAQGFEHYDDQVDLKPPSQTPGTTVDTAERSAEKTTRLAVKWLAERESGRPFFCWVHYFAPHHPWNPPPDLEIRFRDNLYDGEIAYMDREIAVLLKAIRAQGDWDNTLIVVVADHGEGLGDHDEATHTKLIYDTTMRVPLILACPGLFNEPHVVHDEVVSTADIVPTVVDLLGFVDDEPRDGVSLVGGALGEDRAVYLETMASYFDDGWSPLYGLRRHRDKYILAPRPEYYDLRSDPDELDDLYDRASGAALAARDELRVELAERLAQWPAAEGVAAQAQHLDPQAVRKLESLGYIGTVERVEEGAALPDPKDMMPSLVLLATAESLAAAGRLDEALVEIKKAAQYSSHDPRVLWAMGNIYLRQGKMNEAIAAFSDTVASTTNPRFAIIVAESFFEAGRPEMSLEFLEPLRDSNGDNVDVLIHLAVVYQRLGRFDEAFDVLVDAEGLDGDRIETQTNLATCLQRMGRLAEALDYARRAVGLAPDLAKAQQTLGMVLRDLGRDEEAYLALSKAVGLDPRNPKLTQDLAYLCVKLGRNSDAVTHLHSLAALLPTRWEPRLFMARLKLRLGLPDEARDALDAGLRLAPNEPQLHAFARQLAQADGR